eukprot:jgi/Mesen1/4974/ME000248S04257
MECRPMLAASVLLVVFLSFSNPADAVVYRNGHFELVHVVRGIQAAQKKYKTSYNIFLNYINKAGLIKPLENLFATTNTGVTLLVPSDASFRKLSPAVKAKLARNPAILKYVMQYHIILREYPWSVFLKQAPGKSFKTMNGKFVQKWTGFPKTQVILGPVGAKNAFQLCKISRVSIAIDTVVAVHEINKVFLPPNV